MQLRSVGLFPLIVVTQSLPLAFVLVHQLSHTTFFPPFADYPLRRLPSAPSSVRPAMIPILQLLGHITKHCLHTSVASRLLDHDED